MLMKRLNRPARPVAALREAAAVRAVNREVLHRTVEYDRWMAERRYRTQSPAGFM